MDSTAAEVHLGVDLGTSGCRGVAITSSGRVLAMARTPLPAGGRPGPGRSEQDPAAWWQALCAVTHELLARVPQARPAGLAIDGTSGSLLLIDRAGRPLTPGLMYDDASGRPMLAMLADRAPPEAAVHGATSSLAKLLALLADGVPSATTRVTHQAEWLAGRLIDDFRYGDENNCLKLGYDPVAGHWPAWLDGLGIPAGWLPRVRPVGALLGGVGRASAAATGLPAGLPVYAGTTDSIAAALAAGATSTGDAVTSLGSTLVLKLLCEQPIVSAQHGVYSHRVFGRWLVGGASNSGGRVLRAHFSDAEMAGMATGLDPATPTGLDYYPLCDAGERFPVNDPTLPPRLAPRPADPVRFFQGMLEGIAAIERAGYRLLQRLGGPPPRRVISTGGGAGNIAWQKIRQRHLSAPVVTAGATEAAIGAAIVARRGAQGGATGAAPLRGARSTPWPGAPRQYRGDRV